MSGLSCGSWTNTSIGFTVAIRKGRYHLRVCCKTPGAQNSARMVSGAPGAAVIWRTWSVQSPRQISLIGNHCSRCIWRCNSKRRCHSSLFRPISFGFCFILIFAHLNELGLKMESIINFLSATPYWDPRMIAILIAVGAFVGFVNTVAGLATVISYTLFMFMGMPINIANATSRVGVLLQFSTNSLIFRKEGLLDVSLATKVGVPVAVGALLGAEMAAVFKTEIIEVVTAIVLPLIATLLFVDKKKFSQKYHIEGRPEMSPLKYLVFFIIGIYGGFTHAGIGLLVIFGSFIFLGQDLVHSNAIKQLTTVIYTPVALVVFALHGQINWPVALIYAIGNVAGGVLASKVAIKWGEKFIKICVVCVVVVVSFYLLWKQF